VSARIPLAAPAPSSNLATSAVRLANDSGVALRAFSENVTPTLVPEPGGATLLLLGGPLLAARRTRMT